MKRRVFIAISLPSPVRTRIAGVAERISSQFASSIRFIRPEDWHITLSFLGYQDDESLGRALHAVSATASRTAPPSIVFERIVFGPFDERRGTPAAPRMIWLIGNRASSATVGVIRRDLEESLREYRVWFEQEYRQFQLHVTLARLPARHLLPPPPLDILCPAAFSGSGLDCMESTLKRSGAEYAKLAHFDFRGASR